MIHIPKICGTCKGSTKALNLVYEIYEREIQKENPKKIYIYKEILHNPKVIEEFNELGIETIDNLDCLTSDDILIIRAHGEPKETFDYLESNNIEYYDATCANVSKIHKMVLEKYRNGYEIIIVGKSNHPEVIGTNGWCENKGIIIESEDDLDKINNENKKKFIICQTTFNQDKFEILTRQIQNIFDCSEIVIENTLCNAVFNIRKSSVEVAKKCDKMFVIGGLNSSNTKEIYNEVSKYTESYMFSNINDFYDFIKKENISSEINVGITGGASTPIKEIYNYKYLLSFIIFYKERLNELKENQNTINNRLKNNSYNENIEKIIDNFIDLNQDGKYVRGTLIALGYYLATGNNNLEYLNLAYAYEMFQTAVLIHDDIIDNAKTRRGKDTIPRRICKEYLNKNSNKFYHNDVLSLANSLAICSGDLGFYEANNLIIKNYSNHKNLTKLLEFYNDIIIKTIKGEILDVILPFKGKYNYGVVEEKDILDIYHLKTSWYTIIGPFFLGYILGNKEIDDKLKEILNKIGISFQIKDDILGIFSNSDVIGKSNTSDIEEFKQTIMYSHVINTTYKNEFLKIYGKKEINEVELKKIRDILVQSGSYDYAKDYLDNLCSEVVNEINDLEINDVVKDILKGLLIYVNIREK